MLRRVSSRGRHVRAGFIRHQPTGRHPLELRLAGWCESRRSRNPFRLGRIARQTGDEMKSEMNIPIPRAYLTRPLAGRDHMQGPIDAPVALLEYGDYECPYCGEAYAIVKAIQEQLGIQLCFAFRN